jgi:excinuclease ABC subunit C
MQLREHCPRAAGVYGMLDEQGHLIYVGKAKRLRHRLLSYFHAQGGNAKAGEIIRHTRRLIWERTPHELVALARELELIRRFLPRFNVQGRPDRFGRYYVCIGRAPAPYVFIADEPSRRAQACFGPLRGRNRLAEAVRWLNQQFGLRDCPDRVPMIFEISCSYLMKFERRSVRDSTWKPAWRPVPAPARAPNTPTRSSASSGF